MFLRVSQGFADFSYFYVFNEKPAIEELYRPLFYEKTVKMPVSRGVRGGPMRHLTVDEGRQG